MREFKFRAWDKNKNRYEPRYLLAIDEVGDLWRIDSTDAIDLTSEKDRYVIEQFTGLTDKNGKEIYEGDIVRWSFKVERNSELTYTADVVEWESYDEEEWPYSTISGFTLPESEDEYEVIGNIHENPELLGDAER